MNKSYTKKILTFLHIAEKLKNELRHSWTSTGRQESVAEHSWRLAIMVIICSSYLSNELNQLKALKMAIIHDIGEAIIGDIHSYKINFNKQLQHKRNLDEQMAVYNLVSLLDVQGKELFAIWKEFELNKSLEAQFVNFLDKLEVCIQHNEATIDTWIYEEIIGIEKYFKSFETEELILKDLKKYVYMQTKEKLKNFTTY